MTASFEEVFQNVTGHAPYPWQQRLYQRFTEGDKVAALDIPTGLGKTSVMTIWLLTHLLGEAKSRPPMRLIYVVNRRTIVDQATSIAEKLQNDVQDLQQWRDRFGDAPLCVSTLRGALADNGDWLLVPHQPAIIVGTVDMIGSRLLFNGYRAGRWQRSRHAGLLGWDSLLVHDEVHLSRPFQTLLDWVVRRQGESGRRLRIMPMSATANCEGDVLRIDDKDREIAREKLQSVKRVHLHPTKEAADAGKLAELAMCHQDEHARVIIFARLPGVAAKVVEALRKKKVSDERIALLTGTIRGYERDELVKQPILRHLLESTEPQATEYLVATSAGEVGADFDADHLVCDLSTIDAMIQRFGRVNRRGGEGREARIDVLMDNPATAKSLIDDARAACGKFLEALKAEQGDTIDASPQAIETWRDRPGYADACEPEVPTIRPHDAVLDAWSLTSIQQNWPLAHDVHPYLHGLEDSLPETYVAWRAELDHWPAPDARDLEGWLAHYSLRPRELLRDKPDNIVKLIREVPSRIGNDKPMVLVHNRNVRPLNCDDFWDDKTLAREIGYGTVILPISACGLSSAGMIQADFVQSARDVADGDGAAPERRRVIIDADEERRWTGRAVGGTADGEAYEKWAQARDAWGRSLKMRYVGRVVLSRDADERPTRMLLFFTKPIEKSTIAQGKLTIDQHNRDVLDAVQRIAGSIQPGEAEVKALCAAAAHHDMGKGWEFGDGRWQSAVGNANVNEAWAKIFQIVPNWKLLDGYRHEFGSLLAAVKSEAARSLDEPTRDLALHLIAVHHGRGRPHFELEAMKTPPDRLPEELKPSVVARRFDRLQRRYGHWGLAWLESLLMAADAEASKDAQATADEDQDEESEEDR